MTDLSELDRLLAEQDIAPPSLAGPVTERKCRRHVWTGARFGPMDTEPYERFCVRCKKVYDPVVSRRGKQSRNYGNRAELTVARKYGGTKIGHVGGPVDVRGKDFNTQVKTHRRLPPAEWRKVFGALAASGERCPRLLLRFVMGPGLPPVDYLVFQADDFLDWFGRDE